MGGLVFDGFLVELVLPIACKYCCGACAVEHWVAVGVGGGTEAAAATFGREFHKESSDLID